MNREFDLTEEQKERVKSIKDPTIEQIIELSYELEIDPIVLANYFIKKELH